MPKFNYTYIFLVIAATYALQLLLTGWQAKRFFNRLKELRKDGLTSIGLAGGKWSGRFYAVLVVDHDKNIIHAEKLAGMTIFAKLTPVEGLIGINAKDLLATNDDFGLKKKALLGFQNAAKEFFKEEATADEENAGDNTSHDIESIRM